MSTRLVKSCMIAMALVVGFASTASADAYRNDSNINIYVRLSDSQLKPQREQWLAPQQTVTVPNGWFIQFQAQGSPNWTVQHGPSQPGRPTGCLGFAGQIFTAACP